MALKQITEWLGNGAAYDAGVALYELHGTNATLKTLFAKGPNFYTIQKLREELMDINDTFTVAVAEPVAVAVASSEFKKYATPVRVPFNEQGAPAELRALNTKKGELYRKAGFAHSQLLSVNTDAERRVLAMGILKDFEEITNIWCYLDHWTATGTLHPMLKGRVDAPAVSKDEELTAADVKRLIGNLKANISKNKNDATRYLQVKKWEQDLKDLREKYKTFKP